MRGPVNCCYLRSAWKAELYLTFMSRLREQDFIEISITYMNNNEFKHIGKIYLTKHDISNYYNVVLFI